MLKPGSQMRYYSLASVFLILWMCNLFLLCSSFFPIYVCMAYSGLSTLLIIRGPEQKDNDGVGEFCELGWLISFIFSNKFFLSLIENLERRNENECISNFDLLCSLLPLIFYVDRDIFSIMRFRIISGK